MRVLRRMTVLVVFVATSAVAGVLVAALVAPFAAIAAEGSDGAMKTYFALPNYLQIDTPQQVSTLYATKAGRAVPIASFYAEDRVDVTAGQMSSWVKAAAVDTEDPRFYSEGGVDVIGTLRGALATALGHGDDVQGGSSITQQYVKNVLVQQCESPSSTSQLRACYQKAAGVTPARKLQEIRYASALSKTYTKSQILTGYLNIVGLGGTTYGVQAGAEYYFDTDAAHLTLPEAATLVAILNNPSNLRIDEPKNSANGAANGYQLTLRRRNYVLQRMYLHHSITLAERNGAEKAPISPRVTPLTSGCAAAATYDAAYYCSYVRDELENDPAFGKTSADRITALDTEGLKIYTPLRLGLQSSAQAALSGYVPATEPGVDLGGTNITVQPGTGRIITMVQNTGYSNSGSAGQTSVNYNTDKQFGGSTGFQTGSTFKAFTLAAWLEAGHTLEQAVSTAQHQFPFSDFTNSCEDIGGGEWQISNADPAAPELTVLQATAQSVNTAFAQMGTQLDLCSIYDAAKAMGVHLADPSGTFQEFPSMILGVNAISPLTMAGAYAGFADNGTVCTPVAVSKIVNAKGKSVSFTPSKCTQAIPANIAAGVQYALRGVLEPGGTGATANPYDGIPHFAKTGTTDYDEQNWLIASTTNYTNATWVGNVKGQVDLTNWPMLGGTTGYDAKFAIGKALLPALDAKLGGSALPDPEPALVGTAPSPAHASNPTTASPSSPAPKSSTTPAPTPTSTPTSTATH
ncbi:transglycosylase domain-containing protein [Gryllotalpicola reticulitermitis]|uniref:Transglycosylase domain-containing protein n=1 Tax=Gryllotalpicola reticulitermitis TaxID=1184153 RepID=A0ABV8Q6H4_9MICO